MVIQRKSKASSLITAYKLHIIADGLPHCVQIVEDLIIVRLHFLSVKDSVLLQIIAAKRKSFFVDMTPDFEKMYEEDLTTRKAISTWSSLATRIRLSGVRTLMKTLRFCVR